jgi:CBS domain-containing protein
MFVGKLCTREVVIVEPQEHVVDAARLLAKHHIGCLVVVRRSVGDEGDATVPVGIVTDRDIVLRAVAKGVRYLESCLVEDVMSPQLLTAYDDEDLYDVLKQMRSRAVRRVPVLDRNGTLKGILSHDDVLEWFSEEVWDLTRLLVRQREHERQGAPLSF